jgi:hypothetical protein
MIVDYDLMMITKTVKSVGFSAGDTAKSPVFIGVFACPDSLITSLITTSVRKSS